MQTLRKKTSPCKYRNDPGRFFGDGVQFKAKLIGILEVGEARGDRMCQEALQDLKMAIRAAGEHKQRITIHVTIDGLRLRDEKTGDSLYHHPVHKISFIAQDMTDSRAFGYIFGSPDSGHRFFGIKTDKAASQVVLAMRDLFQVVFELKKKEIEMARQQIQGKSLHEHASQLASLSALRAGAGHADLASGGHPLTLSSLCGQDAYSNGTTRLGVNLDVAKTSGAAAKEISPESVADLVDLEQELTSLQRGITQMERITPSEPGMHHPSSGGGGSGHPGSLAKSASEDDPFGDSFICVPSYSILPPPPESGRNRHKPQKTPESAAALDAILSPPAPGASSSPAPGVACQASGVDNDDDSWLHELDQQNDVFDTTNVVAAVLSMAPLAASESTATPTQQLTEMSAAAAAATASTSLADLDMGGALTGIAGTATTEEPAIMSLEPLTSSINATTTTTTLEDHQDPANPVLLPRDTDPFSPTRKKSDPDPFQEGDLFAKLDAFEFDAPTPLPVAAAIPVPETRTSAFNGPLQVQLPPEKGEQVSTVRNRPTVSASSLPNPLGGGGGGGGPLDVISSISNKKMPHLFGQARGFSKRGDSSSSEIGSSVNMRRLQESDSLSETEAAPEPPPRPDSAPCSGPPPLPPKKQFSDLVIRPSPAPPTAGRYEYLNSSSSSTRRTLSHSLADSPPIPLPSRRVGRTEACFPGPGRPRKPHQPEDDYMIPLGPPPPLLPPPNQVSSSLSSSTARARPQRQQSLGRPQDIYENKAEILAQAASQEVSVAPALPPDITLTQLLTLGMDDLAVKLNVPASKLSTMTLVQLTSYLSEYLSSSEKTSQSLAPPTAAAPVAPPPATVPAASSSAAVFKVSFDQQTSFVASFDDTFGEDEATTGVASPPEEAPIFVANFANFNEAPIPAAVAAPVAVPSADRYAVFREIIDQELQQQQQETDLMGDLTPPPVDEQETAQEPSLVLEARTELPLIDSIVTSSAPPSAPPPPLPKIDTKITEVVAQAKDRYAALRDIILVENLFDKPQTQSQAARPPPPEKDLLQDFPEFSDEFNEDQDLRQIMDLPLAEQQHPQDRHGLVDSRGFPAEPSSSALTVDDDDEDEDADAGGESSMDSNEKDGEPVSGQDKYEKLSTSTQQLDAVVPASLLEEESSSIPLPLAPKQDHKFLSVLTAPPVASGSGSAKDDIEIDELMHRAISNLSLDSRDRISPATSSAAPSRGAQSLGVRTPSQQFNDVSTSPIPLQKSPAVLQPSPVPSHLSAVSQLIDTATKQMMSEREREKQSWATFDSPKAKGKARLTLPPPPPPASNTSQQDTAESPCSSDPRDDGWSKQQRRWAKKERHQTSSSSRDLSPWDDETPEYLKRRQMAHAQPQPQHTDRHGYYMRHARRMNSCDEDYDYDAELMARREREQQQRKFKHGLSRSRDNFDLDSPSWYHHPTHHTWSPQEIEQGVRARSFERSAYERSSYGPPMYADKRGGQQQQLRSKYRGERERDRDREREREREYRDYARPSYDFDYENVYEEQRGGRSPMAYKSSGRGAGGGDYMYERERERDRDRKSFDRESLESFESATRRRRSFGSGNDVYGSLDSRDEYRGGVDRERDRGEREREQMKTRSLRKPTTTSGKLRISGDIDYEQDSEQDFQQRASVRSLQRPSQLGGDVVLPIGGGGGIGGSQRLRKSSGSSPWDGEEPALPGQKSWKRPASAAETERRLAESRRAVALGQTPSDGEKERRFRKKTRARSAKDLATVGGLGSGSSSIVNPPPPRYVGGSGRGMRDNYDYMSSHQLQQQQQQRKDVDVDDDDVADDDDDDEDYVDDEPPTDEDKFERLNRRRHEMHQRMLESERRQMERHPTLSKLQSTQNRSRGAGGVPPVINSDYGFVDSYEQTPTPTPRSNASSTVAGMMSGGMMGSGGESSAGVAGGKFNFDDGFESDFNQSSPPPAPAGTASSCNSTPAGPISGGSVASGGSKSLFRFSNDFSEKGGDKREHFEMDPLPTSTPPITQKLRFDDNVKISQFDDAAFEDDFAKASFDFEKEQTSAGGGATASGGSVALTRKQNMRTTKMQQRQELIKKSESVNIFAKKQEDPFEDDEFFKSPDQDQDQQKDNDGGEAAATANNKFQWNEDENFAKFDENM
ncbi:protein disabled isoform X3 [Drosophila obscura]|uniref:protein disabled isoform X3 n=1 Tax=Drosophila obscura TaxID=7282 RepID=UPI001BB203A8|nr:protein disabled isoform X3 [Drosophila obscura]